MLGEWVFTFENAGIEPDSPDAKERLYHVAHDHRKEAKQDEGARRGLYRISAVWPRGHDYFYEVLPTSLYEEERDGAEPDPSSVHFVRSRDPLVSTERNLFSN